MNKDKILERLYNERNLRFEVKFKESDVWWTVDTIYNLNEPDCKIGSFAKNYYFRTTKGVNSGKYSSFDNMINDIKKTAKNKGLTLEKYKVYEKDGYGWEGEENIVLYDNLEISKDLEEFHKSRI